MAAIGHAFSAALAGDGAYAARARRKIYGTVDRVYSFSGSGEEICVRFPANAGDGMFATATAHENGLDPDSTACR